MTDTFNPMDYSAQAYPDLYTPGTIGGAANVDVTSVARPSAPVTISQGPAPRVAAVEYSARAAYDPVAGLRPADAPWYRVVGGKVYDSLDRLGGNILGAAVEAGILDPDVDPANFDTFSYGSRLRGDQLLPASRMALETGAGMMADAQRAREAEARISQGAFAAGTGMVADAQRAREADAQLGQGVFAAGAGMMADAQKDFPNDVPGPYSTAAVGKPADKATAAVGKPADKATAAPVQKLIRIPYERFRTVETPSHGTVLAPIDSFREYAGQKVSYRMSFNGPKESSTGFDIEVLTPEQAAADVTGLVQTVEVSKDGLVDANQITTAKDLARYRTAVESGVGGRYFTTSELTSFEAADGRIGSLIPANLIPSLAGKAVVLRRTETGTEFQVVAADHPAAMLVDQYGAIYGRAKKPSIPEPPKKEWYENPMAMLAVSSALSVIGVIGQYFIAKDGSDTQLKINRDNRNTQLELLGMQLAATGGGGGGGGGGGKGSLRAGRVF